MQRYYEVPGEVLEDRDVLTTVGTGSGLDRDAAEGDASAKPRAPSAKQKTKKKSR